MYFTSNHDENSWNKADYETMPGKSHAPFAVFTQTYNRAMPLVYSGQEEPVLRAVAFFEKDSMGFNKYQRAPFYKTLLNLRSNHAAFKEEAVFERLQVNLPKQVVAYSRKNGDAMVVVVLNFANKAANVKIEKSLPTGKNYTEIFSGKNTKNIGTLNLPAWGYQVFVYGQK